MQIMPVNGTKERSCDSFPVLAGLYINMQVASNPSAQKPRKIKRCGMETDQDLRFQTFVMP